MRILWVEDFEGNHEGICRNVFSTLCSKEMLDALIETQSRNQAQTRPRAYSEWRKWYGNRTAQDLIEIDIYRRYQDFKNTFAVDGVANIYDIVLLDVNLENNFFPADGDIDIDPREGGFRLYNELIISHFPAERIVLLTAHSADTATKEFQQQAKKNNHVALKSFPKDNDAAGKWINEKGLEKHKYLYFRRGALDGIEYVTGLLAKDTGTNAALHFNDFVAKHKHQMTSDEAKKELKTLKQVIPLMVTSEEATICLEQIRNAIFLKWERAIPDYKKITCCTDRAVGSVMKSLRNWAAHNLLPQSEVADIAYWALLDLRALVSLEGESNELRPYEHQLLAAISSDISSKEFDGISSVLASSYVDTFQRLIDEVRKGTSSHMRDKEGKIVALKVPSGAMFVGLVNELANASPQLRDFNFLLALRLMFVHVSLLERYPSLDGPRESNLAHVAKAYQEAFENCRNAVPEWVQRTWICLINDEVASKKPM